MNNQLFLDKFQAKYRGETDRLRLTNYLKEELQLLLLEAIYAVSFPERIYFMGGTCLHLCYQLPRFSEDLDFSLNKPAPAFHFVKFAELLRHKFNPEVTGMATEMNIKNAENVKKIIFKFPELLYSLNLSPLQNTKIQINFECDVNPPQGAQTKLDQLSSVFNSFYINQFDLPTCFAGKIGALLCREYTKGRDYFDVRWLLKELRELQPNYVYLSNRLKQSGLKIPDDPHLLKQEVFTRLIQKIQKVDLSVLKKDLQHLVQMSEKNFSIYLENYQEETISALTVAKGSVL